VLLDHYFIPPLDDFAVAGPDNVVTLVAFVLVAGAASSVVGLAARRREAEALATANDLRFLRWGGVGLKPTTQGL
jgi:K+-sensing histidine kinase KdpD